MNLETLMYYGVLATTVFWIFVVVISTAYAMLQLWKGRSRMQAFQDPYLSFPISILKPLKGLEDNLEENLEAFFHLDYPQYEILFSVTSGTDAACPLVHELMERYPDVKARLIVGGAPVGANPKINNLIYSYQLAEYDYVLICDSTILPEPLFLRRMASYCVSGVGLVTAAVAGINGSGVGGWLEALYLNTFYLRWTYVGRLLRTPVVAGKAMLFRRTTANRFGGLRALAPYLAEDYMLAKAIQKLGLKVEIMHDPVYQQIGDKSFGEFWSRHLRWGRIRKALAPLAFAFEWMSGPIFTSCLLCLVPWTDLKTRILFGAVMWAIWGFCDLLLWWSLHLRPSIAVGLTWMFRECLAPLLWLHTILGSTVTWKGARIRLGPNTRVVSSRDEMQPLRLAPNP